MTLLAIAGCHHSPGSSSVKARSIEALADGIAVTFDQPAPLREIVVRDRQGNLLARLPVAGARTNYQVPFDWPAAGEYAIELQLAGRAEQARLTVPQRRPLRATLEAPLGQNAILVGSVARANVLVPENGTLPVGLLIESLAQAPSRYEMRVWLDGATATSSDPRLTIVGDELSLSGTFTQQYEYLQADADWALLPGRKTAEAKVVFRQSSDESTTPRQQELRLTLVAATLAELRRQLAVADVVFPADGRGGRQSERPADTIALASPAWSRLRRLFAPLSVLEDEHAPYAHQAVRLSNRAAVPVNLLVESEVLDRRTRQPLLDFAPPAWKSPRESPTSEHLLRIAPRQTATAVIPVYARRSVAPGEYDRRVRVFLVGSREPLVEFTAPLTVTRGSRAISAVVFGSLLGAVVVWGTLAIVVRRLVARIGLEGITTIALLAGFYFVVSYASRIGGDLIAGVTGPFYIFLAGLGSEGLTSLLLAALIVLIPRPGVILLTSATVFLLQAMFTGQFGLADLLFVSVSILLFELALALLGITTGRALEAPGAVPSRWTLVRVATAIGIANAAALYAQFCLIQVLYRLFFAGWYIIAVALITGLVYGAAGAYWGTQLGFRLRRTAR